MNTVSEKIKIDPSEVRQVFSNMNIKLLCCRYWVLSDWHCMDLSVPFWRIYHNNISGAKVLFKGEVFELNKNVLLVIPPNTSFSTQMGEVKQRDKYEHILGRKIEKKDSIATISAKNRVDHLFIHFSLGFPLDFAQPGIYSFDCSPETYKLIVAIQESCIDDTYFTLLECLRIKQLINVCLLNIKDNIWRSETIDPRIFTAMKTIERSYNTGISNSDLASAANMAVNSFSRLFKTSTGQSVQQYIAKTKIEIACNFMHHSNKTIDEIADSCGFYDRHHFSKIFKRIMKVNPSYYMKNLTIN